MRNQKGWVCTLLQVQFDLMNTINQLTGFTLFQTHLGRSPQVLSPLIPSTNNTNKEKLAEDIIQKIPDNVQEAQDNLLMARVAQVAQANKARSEEPRLKVGNFILLNTHNRCREFQQKKDRRTANFMPRFDGKYKIIHGLSRSVYIHNQHA